MAKRGPKRGSKKSAAHRKAIAAGMRKYWNSSRAKSRRVKGVRRRASSKKSSGTRGRRISRNTGSVRRGKGRKYPARRKPNYKRSSRSRAR